MRTTLLAGDCSLRYETTIPSLGLLGDFIGLISRAFLQCYLIRFRWTSTTVLVGSVFVQEMGACIICGTSVDGRICGSHEEDVVFDFRGNSPDQLESNRFYHGEVDGYADFGVFVDLSSNVTGLLHRSELDRRLESLEWEPGDNVFIKVTNVRDNGNIDLAWSIRQSAREFRGELVQEDGTTRVPDSDDDDSDSDSESETDADTSSSANTGSTADSAVESDQEPESSQTSTSESASQPDPDSAGEAQHRSKSHGDAAQSDTDSIADTESDGITSGSPAESNDEDSSEQDNATATDDGSVDSGTTIQASDASSTDDGDDVVDTDESEGDFEFGSESASDTDRVPVASLDDRVGDTVRVEGEIASARQTGGPTVFELRDESGVVDCAAFVEPGVRAYPDIDAGDTVFLEGEVELRREELQIEADELEVLDGTAAEAVTQRLTDAMTDRARPSDVTLVGGDETVESLPESLLDAAETIRRAIFQDRPIVVRHPASADGYVAGAAIERAVLPLVREEHSESDAEYHYFTRRPIEESVYDMDDATNDTSRMLQNRDRHDENLPLFLLIGTGSTTESADGLRLLDIYDAERVVVDASVADPEVAETVNVLVSPDLADTDGTLSNGALATNLASTVNSEVSGDIEHLPAVSYWESPPDAYTTLAADAGYDSGRIAELREAIALEAYHQSYQDKRELIADLLFDDDGDLARHVAEQFREKLDREIDTAVKNLQSVEVDGIEASVLDTDAFTHRFDFPPKTLLLDELHRSNRDTHSVTLGVGTDELYLRSTADLNIRDVAEAAGEQVPDADLEVADIRAGRIEFLAGEREAAENAVIDVTADLF